MSDTVDKLLSQAFQARRENRLGEAQRNLVEAVDLCRHSNVPVKLGQALTGLGQIERDLHRSDVARQHYEEAAAIYRAESDALRLAHAVRHLGDLHREAGHFELAEPCYDEAVGLYRRSERTPHLDLANTIRGLAILKEDAGEAEQARMLWEEARDLNAAVNVTEGVNESSRRLALLARGRGLPE